MQAVNFMAFFCFHYTIAKLSIQDENHVPEPIKTAIDIANLNFDYRKTTVVIDKDVDDKIVNNFLINYKGSVIVKVKRETAPGQVVILLDTFLSFMEILHKLKPDLRGKSLLNSSSKFLIVLLSNGKKIERINNILWNYYATDVVIVTRNKKNAIVLYTYYPYKNHLDCRNVKPTVIDVTNRTLNNLYTNKMRNMNECPVYISTNKINYPTTEIKMPLDTIKKTIIRSLRDLMKFTPIIMSKDFISIDSIRARNWSDSLSDLITGDTNISTCTIPLGIDKLGLLDYSMPYFRIRLAWIAPPIAPGPGWWRLISPLNGYLWLVLLIVIFFVKSLPYIMKTKRIKKFCYTYFKNTKTLRGTVFKIWGVLVGQPVRMAPKKFRDFYIIGLWMWFTFVIRNAYQSVLIGALKTETIVGNFANLKETVEAGYPIGGREGIYTHFEFDPLIRERFQILSEKEYDIILSELVEGRKKFVLATSLEYAVAYCLSIGKQEKECGHILPDSIMSVPLVVWMKENSPFVKPFSIWLPRFIESGLLSRDSLLKSSFCRQVPSNSTPLNHRQILSCLCCLFVGYVISLTVLLLEVFRFKVVEHVIDKKFPYRN